MEQNKNNQLSSPEYSIKQTDRIADLDTSTINLEQEKQIPDVLYRGERVYLNNIDQLGQRDLSTVEYERTGNQHGKVFLSRDIDFAINYSIGTDGVVWYDHKLSKEEIPIGVIYKIANPGNIINAVPEGDPLPDFIGGELAGEYREFTANFVPAEQYQVVAIIIMDDYIQQNGHNRSDMRDILESFPVSSPAELQNVIEAVKQRINELDIKQNVKAYIPSDF